MNTKVMCFAERGFDFAYVTCAFVDPKRFIKKDRRRDYGKGRYQLLGSIDQRVFFVGLHCAAKSFELFQHKRLINVRQIIMKPVTHNADSPQGNPPSRSRPNL
ncbi:MAG: hypothetical protein ACXWTK_00175, partial [Methylobacter sp.]